MSYDKAVEEIKTIFASFNYMVEKDFNIDLINKELEKFLERFENGCIENNREAIEEQALENYEPAFDMHELD